MDVEKGGRMCRTLSKLVFAAELLPSVRSINIIISVIHPFIAAIQSRCGVIGSVELCVIGRLVWAASHL
jgi:hypothetical protein